jgi:hypothetical protein
MNKPYVKSHNEDGSLVDQFETVTDEKTGKTTKIYKSESDNRKARREYRKRIQTIVTKTGAIKTIKHLDLKGVNY